MNHDEDICSQLVKVFLPLSSPTFNTQSFVKSPDSASRKSPKHNSPVLFPVLAPYFIPR